MSSLKEQLLKFVEHLKTPSKPESEKTEKYTKKPGAVIKYKAPKRKLLSTQAPSNNLQAPSRTAAPENQKTKKNRQKRKASLPSPLKTAKKASRGAKLSCPLCGASVSAKSMRSHKINVHGEGPIEVSKTKPKSAFKPWIRLVQGGSPGSGRNH